MLVLHASSRCDVCLESYGFNTADEAPHAIPCGHIFCKTCLHSLAPPVACPLCRKAFVADRAKRLHVDRPPESTVTGSASTEELERLQRLALVSGENAPPESLVEVMEEIEGWLGEQSPNSNKPLRAAWDALRRFQKLKDQHDKDKAQLRDQERQIRHRDRNTAHDRQTAKAVEESLLTRLQEVESEYAAKASLSAAENEVETLQTELTRFRKTSNPLPPPPEPLPLDQLPHFIHPLSESISQPVSQPPPASNARHPNNHIPVSEVNTNSFNAQAHINPNNHAHFEPLPPALQADLAKAAEMERSMRKAVKKRIPTRQHTPAHEYTNPRQFPAVGGPDHLSGNKYRVGIIPGASPTQRVVPPHPRWVDTDVDAPTPLGENERAWHERNGDGWWLDQELDRAAENSMSAARQVLRDVLGSGSASPVPPTHPRATVEEVLDPSPFAPTAAYVTGYASGYGSGYALASGPDLVYGDSRLDSPDLERAEHDGLGLYGVTAPPVSGYMMEPPPGDFVPTPRPIQLHRRNTTSSMGVSESSAPAARPVYANPAHGDATPATSWGTVQTRRTTHDSYSGRGSMSDLGLLGLHAGGGVRGNGTVVASVPTTPARFGGEGGYRRDVIDREEITHTPRADRSVVHPQTHGQALNYNDIPIDTSSTRRSRHSRSLSHPEQPMQTHDENPTVRTNRSSRHRNARRTSLAGRQRNTVTPVADAYDSWVDRNALALSFDQSSGSSVQSHVSESRPPSVYPNISAPTPIVSTRNIMRSWAVDT